MPIIIPVIFKQMACSLPKSNTKFHQLFKYVKKDAIFSSIRWENSKNIFGWRSLLGTVGMVFSVPHQLASLFILEEEIIELIEKSNIENSVFVDYLQLWKARYNELKTNDELNVRSKIILKIF